MMMAAAAAAAAAAGEAMAAVAAAAAAAAALAAAAAAARAATRCSLPRVAAVVLGDTVAGGMWAGAGSDVGNASSLFGEDLGCSGSSSGNDLSTDSTDSSGSSGSYDGRGGLALPSTSAPGVALAAPSPLGLARTACSPAASPPGGDDHHAPPGLSFTQLPLATTTITTGVPGSGGGGGGGSPLQLQQPQPDWWPLPTAGTISAVPGMTSRLITTPDSAYVSEAWAMGAGVLSPLGGSLSLSQQSISLASSASSHGAAQQRPQSRRSARCYDQPQQQQQQQQQQVPQELDAGVFSSEDISCSTSGSDGHSVSEGCAQAHGMPSPVPPQVGDHDESTAAVRMLALTGKISNLSGGGVAASCDNLAART
jgi:hypothetical protein